MPAPTPSEQRNAAAEKVLQASQIQEAADEKNVSITAEESAQIQELLAQAEQLKQDAERREKITIAKEDLEKLRPRLSAPTPSAGSVKDADNILPIIVPAEAKDRDLELRHGFRTFGEFSKAVYDCRQVGLRDKRLDFFSVGTGNQAKTGPDGGFLMPPSFSRSIWDGLNAGTANLLAMTDSYTVEGESLTFPANAETTRATGSRYGGIQAFWAAEGSTLQKSSPAFRQVKVEPNDLFVLVPVTNKLLSGSMIALEQYLTRAAIDEINFMVGDGIINGTGAGQPRGILNSGATVTVSKESSQAADTILEINLAKMWSRLHVNARARAVWFINQDCESQLDTLSITVRNQAGTDNVGGYQSGIYDRQNNTIKGRPVMPIEFAATLGDLGDVILADMKGYVTGVRGGIESAMSIHLYFDSDKTAFRFKFSVDGQPWLASPLTPFKGTNTLSTFVILEAR